MFLRCCDREGRNIFFVCLIWQGWQDTYQNRVNCFSFFFIEVFLFMLLGCLISPVIFSSFFWTQLFYLWSSDFLWKKWTNHSLFISSTGFVVLHDLGIYYGMEWEYLWMLYCYVFFILSCLLSLWLICFIVFCSLFFFFLKLGLYLPSILVLFLECFRLFCMVGGALFGKRFGLIYICILRLLCIHWMLL